MPSGNTRAPPRQKRSKNFLAFKAGGSSKLPPKPPAASRTPAAQASSKTAGFRRCNTSWCFRKDVLAERNCYTCKKPIHDLCDAGELNHTEEVMELGGSPSRMIQPLMVGYHAGIRPLGGP